MCRNHRIPLFAFILISISLVYSISSSAEVKASTICRLGKTVRTLRVVKLKDGRCQTIYTKAGEDKEVGSGLNQNSCEKIFQDIKVNLEKAHWDCKDTKSPTMTDFSNGQ